ncbi:MAG: hypothetical protein K6E33_05465 [Lachnospiraceae bacterium]|nr:hypothetical protein [Lachnospiraceae bacterium]
MNPVIEVVNTVLPVLIMLGAGVVCRRKELISRDGVNALKNVAVNICLPAVMLNAFATMHYSMDNVIVAVMMFLVCVLAWGLGKAMNSFLKTSPFLPFLTTGFEAGMLGYSLFALLYGPENISDFACVDLGQVLFVFTLYKMLLGRENNEKTDYGNLFSEMIKSPTIIAIIAGVLLGATGIYEALIPSGISSVIDACTSFISNPTAGIILISVGYDLVLDNIPWAGVLKTTFSRILIMIVLRIAAGFVVDAFSMGEGLKMAMNMMFILPPPYVLPVFADDEEQRNYVSSSLSVITLVTVLGFVILAVVQA